MEFPDPLIRGQNIVENLRDFHLLGGGKRVFGEKSIDFPEENQYFERRSEQCAHLS